jgi:DNA-binding CsgD family transcriptional regulator
MMSTGAFDAHQVIDLIYEASLDPKGWARVADALGPVLGGVATLFVSTSSGMRCLAASGPQAGCKADDVTDWGEDLSIARLGKADTGAIFLGRRIARPGRAPAEISLSLRSSYCTVLWRDAQRAVVLAVVAESSEGFAEARLRRLDALRPHFYRALALHGRLSAVEIERDASFAALDRASVGLLIVTTDGAIRFSSSLAEARLLEAGLVRRNDKVAALNIGSSYSLRRAIAAASNVPAVSSLVRLSMNEGEGASVISVLPWPIGDEALVMLLLSGEQSAPDNALLRDNYGLTTSEGRLLEALVAGERLAEYAERAGVRISTAKTHLRSVFCKTGERRQADLVRRALTDPALRFSFVGS